MVGYVTCGTSHHIHHCWELMARCVTCVTSHCICQNIWWSSALQCLMLEEAFQVCCYPCWACIKITVFVWLLQLMSHWVDVSNILYWRTLRTASKLFNFHFSWTVFMTTWHEHVHAFHSIHVSDLYMCAMSICPAVASLLGYSENRLCGVPAKRSKCVIIALHCIDIFFV